MFLMKQKLFLWHYTLIFVTCKSTKGPYFSRLIKVRDCLVSNETSYPLDEKFPYVTYHAKVVNTKTETYLQGRYTVLKDIPNLKMRLRSYLWEDSQWKIQLAIPALSENRAIVSFVMKAFGVPYSNHTIFKGAYFARLLKVRDCLVSNETSYPLAEKFPYIAVHAKVVNTKTGNYLQGRFTILKDIPNLKVRIRSYLWEDSQWKIQLAIPALSENRAIVSFIIKAFGIPYKNHTIFKSPLRSFNVNVDRTHHVWETEKAYGKWLWLIQLLVAKKSAYCVYLQMNIDPIKK